jgi:hypothetical protein
MLVPCFNIFQNFYKFKYYIIIRDIFMTKFCHNCGETLFDENATFCSFCGTRVVKEGVSEPKDASQPAPENIPRESRKVNTHSWAGILLGIIPVIIAIFVLLNLYLFPDIRLAGAPVSIAQLNVYCGESFFYATFGPHCDRNFLFFYIGWLVSVLLMIAGIYELYYTLRKSS